MNLTLPGFQSELDTIMQLKKGKSITYNSEGELVLCSAGSEKNLRCIQHLVNEIIDQLNEAFDPSWESDYKKIFFRKIAHLSDKLYDRSRISDQVLEALCPNYFSAYEEYRENYQEIGPYELTQDVHYYDVAVKVVRLGLKLGVSPEPISAGVNGTYCMKDLDGKELGIFKPRDEEILAKNSASPLRKFRVAAGVLPFCNTIIFLQGGNGYKSEHMASLISEYLELYNVPTTRIESLKSLEFRLPTGKQTERRVRKKGSFQLYIPNSLPGKKVIRIPRKAALIPWSRVLIRKSVIKKTIFQDEFERWVITDFLTGHVDRHTDNWRFSDSKVYLIDNATSMAHKHSDSRISRLNQYPWGTYPQAKNYFSEEARIRGSRIKSEVDEIVKLFKEQKLFSGDGQEKAFRERVEVLSHYLLYGKTPKELAGIRSTKDFRKALKIIRSRKDLALSPDF